MPTPDNAIPTGNNGSFGAVDAARRCTARPQWGILFDERPANGRPRRSAPLAPRFCSWIGARPEAGLGGLWRTDLHANANVPHIHS